MKFIKVLIAYLFYFTICSAAKAHNIDIATPTNVTKSASNKIITEEKIDHAHKKGPSQTESKQANEVKTICIDPKSPVKVQLSSTKPKSMGKPINFIIDTKPRNFNAKRPLVIKKGNVYPAPAHYVRLKSDPIKKNKIKPKVEINFNLNKPKMKVIAKDKILPKSVLSLALQNSKEKQVPRKKSKSYEFYEDDDTNIASLPSALKPPGTKKNKKQDKNDSFTDIEVTNNSKHKKHNTETENDQDNEVVNIRNGTHLIRITKLPESKTGHQRSKKPHEHVFYENPLVSTSGLTGSVNLNKEGDAVALVINENGVESATEQTGSKVEQVLPIVTTPVVPEDDSSGVITITNRNYEEVEERPSTYPENSINDNPNQPWATPLPNVAKNPYNYYVQNLQAAYDQYLKYIADNNPGLYNKGNCYPRVDSPDILKTANDPDTTQKDQENQAVQDVYYGQKPDFNLIDIRPENSLGRIWRTWKDTEIKISKPNALLSKAIELGRNLNDINFGDYGKSPMYGGPAIGYNGYYDNINNPLTYPYSYPAYRYML